MVFGKVIEILGSSGSKPKYFVVPHDANYNPKNQPSLTKPSKTVRFIIEVTEGRNSNDPYGLSITPKAYRMSEILGTQDRDRYMVSRTYISHVQQPYDIAPQVVLDFFINGEPRKYQATLPSKYDGEVNIPLIQMEMDEHIQSFLMGNERLIQVANGRLEQKNTQKKKNNKVTETTYFDQHGNWCFKTNGFEHEFWSRCKNRLSNMHDDFNPTVYQTPKDGYHCHEWNSFCQFYDYANNNYLKNLMYIDWSKSYIQIPLNQEAIKQLKPGTYEITFILKTTNFHQTTQNIMEDVPMNFDNSM